MSILDAEIESKKKEEKTTDFHITNKSWNTRTIKEPSWQQIEN